MAGRRSKGDRHAFMTRVPRSAADQLIAEAEARGLSFSDLIAHHVAAAYGVDFELKPARNDHSQQELPLQNVS